MASRLVRNRHLPKVHDAIHGPKLDSQRPCNLCRLHAAGIKGARLFGLLKRRGFGPPVSGLLQLGCPPAVRWFVISESVDSVKRTSCWSWAHVLKKILKRCPPIADGHAQGAVPWIARTFWIGAALNHGAPRFVFSRAAKPMEIGFGHCRFSVKASTRPNQTSPQAVDGCDMVPSTFAFAEPQVYTPAFLSSRSNGCEFPKLLLAYIVSHALILHTGFLIAAIINAPVTP